MQYSVYRKLKCGACPRPRASTDRFLDEKIQNAARFRPLRVIFIRGSVKYSTVVIEDVGRRNRQLPTVVAIDEREIDEGALVDLFLFIGHAICQTELACNMIPGIREKRESQLVLIAHEE